MSQSIEMNLGSPAFKANPYPVFAQLRECDPIHKITLHSGRSAWLITRYKDVEAALRDERFAKDVRNVFTPEELAQRSGLGMNFFNQQMLSFDPPDHTRLRSLVNLSFTPRLVEQWRERIQQIADELLAAVEGRGEMDLINDFAFPLPILVISEMLGVPASDRMKFRAWSNLLIDAAGNPDAIRQNLAQFMEFHHYLVELIEKKRQAPADDLLSKLIQAEAAGDQLSETELISMTFLLLVAGHETTVNLIGNGVLALLEHPDQLALLKEHPELAKTAVEEFLRYRGPLLQATQRWAREDLEFGGVRMRRGDFLMLALAAANRDDEEFTDPDQLDITRQENRHLAFGKGIHYCLGAPLARLEGQIAFNTLLRRLPNLRLNADPQTLPWRPGTIMMGLSSLPVAF